MDTNRPKVAITMGDPAGIGPEVVVKALSDENIYEICCPIVIGKANVFEEIIKILGINFKVNKIYSIEDAKYEIGTLDVLELTDIEYFEVEFGKVSRQAGHAAFSSIKKAIELAINKSVDATVTAPINKEALNAAGCKFAGHTEIYSHYTNTKDYAMLLAEGNLRVVHVSTHVSLREACDRVTKENVYKTILLTQKALERFGISKPKIGVAGLNPHSGENGLFGREEIDEIIPAVLRAKEDGIDVDGPISADTVFSEALGGKYDIVVAMYHDQGHIPLKLKGFVWDKKTKRLSSVNGVNITLGLPIIRSSVDHGTAFAIAGKGVANQNSMINAIEYAVLLAKSSTT